MAACVDFPYASYSCEQEKYNGSLLEKINKRVSSADQFFSLEFYPPRTQNGTCNLIEKCDRFMEGKPLFCDVTYDMKTDGKCENQGNRSIKIANVTQELLGVETMLQLDCARLTEGKALEILQQAKSLGLRNILAMKEGKFSLIPSFVMLLVLSDAIYYITL